MSTIRAAAFLVALGAVPVLGSGCSDDSSTAPLPPPVEPQFMTADVTGDYYRFNATLFEGHQDPATGSLTISGVDHYNGGQPQITIRIFDYRGPRRYQLNGVGSDGIAEYDSYTRGSFTTTPLFGGYIDVDAYDAERQVVSGGFEFNAIDYWGYLLAVRLGSYEVTADIGGEPEKKAARRLPRASAAVRAPIPTTTAGEELAP